jgi:hypothetical protein
MKFECRDLDRALSVPELLPDAREHAKECPACRRQLWLWSEMSSAAAGMREEWETPALWPKIQAALAAEPRRSRSSWFEWRWFEWRWFDWRMVSAVAASLVIAAGLLTYSVTRFRPKSKPESPDFLTEQALKDVEQSEAAYVKSINKLSALAPRKLEQAPEPLSAAYREKLTLLDQSIAELRATIDDNRFNARLQTELANLYREKHDTLQEIMRLGQKN